MKAITLNPFTFLPTPDYTMPVALSSGVGVTLTPPAGAGSVAFSFNTDFWATYGSTGAVSPSSVSSGSSGAELNPTVRNFGSTRGTTGITLYADSAAKGSVSWFMNG